jgi:Ino eighty subunit 1
MNLIFVLASHSAVRIYIRSSPSDVSNSIQSIGLAHFSENIDFIDLFIRKDVSSVSRGRAFLWLCYHYLEAPSTDGDDDYDEEGPANPFADHRRGNIPTFVLLSESEIMQENVDPEEEKILAGKLVAQRAEKLRIQGAKESNKDKGPGKISVAGSVVGDEEDEIAPSAEEAKPKGKRGSGKIKASLATKERKAVAEKLRQTRLKDQTRELEVHSPVPAPRSDDEYIQFPSQSRLPFRFARKFSKAYLLLRYDKQYSKPIPSTSTPLSTPATI